MPFPFIESSANISITVFEFRSRCGGSSTSSNGRKFCTCNPRFAGVRGKSWRTGRVLEGGRGHGSVLGPPGEVLDAPWSSKSLGIDSHIESLGIDSHIESLGIDSQIALRGLGSIPTLV